MNKEKTEKKQNKNKTNKINNVFSKIGKFLDSHYDKGIVGLIMMPFRLIAVLVFRITYGKNWRQELDRYNNMKDSIENASKDKDKTEEKTPEEKKKEKEELFQNAEKNTELPHQTRQEVIETSKEKFNGLNINQVFQDKEKLEEFTKYLDNYLDETFLKGQTKEYDLSVYNENQIKISILNKETKESELKLIIDKNGVIGKQNKDDLLIYEAFLNFSVKSGVSIEPSYTEISNTIKEKAEKLMRESTSEFDIRGKKFIIEKDKEDKITLKGVIQNYNIANIDQGNIITYLVQDKPINEINFDELALNVKDEITNEMVAEINDFRKTEKIVDKNEFFNDKSLKESLDYIDKKYGYDGHSLDIYNNKVYFYKQENELSPVTILAMNIEEVGKNEKTGSSQKKYFTIDEGNTTERIPDDVKRKMKEELTFVKNKIFNADLKDVIENTTETEGKVVINDITYNFKAVAPDVSELYELSINDEVVMTYDASTNDLTHNEEYYEKYINEKSYEKETNNEEQEI